METRPLGFEANHGQFDERVRFAARSRSYSVFLTDAETVIALGRSPRARRSGRETPRLAASSSSGPAVLRMRLAASNPAPRVTGLEPLPGKLSYFRGNDPSRWRTDIPTYARVRYHEVYPGVDVVYYGTRRQLEYDLVTAPGADPRAITLVFDGALGLQLGAAGELVIRTAGGPVRLGAPVIYQEVGGSRRSIAGGYVLRGAREVGFHVAGYDRTKPLVIDPVLVYSTYVGGESDDYGTAIAVGAGGHVYVAGWTASWDFPGWSGAVADSDAFVFKMAPGGQELLYTAVFGGAEDEHEVIGLAVDAKGSAYVTGSTPSPDFPTTAGAFQGTSGGAGDGFVVKLDATGSRLLYATYLGGSGHDGGQKVAVDRKGHAYVVGFTRSSDFRTTAGAFRTTLGGDYDAFVTKLTPDGSGVIYSTYLGGLGFDFGSGVAVDAAGHVHVTGPTFSADFPVTAGAFQTALGGASDAFVAKLSADGSRLVYATYLGGSGSDGSDGIAVDPRGDVYVVGSTHSLDFPTTAGAFSRAFTGRSDVFAVKLGRDGSALVYGTYLGGSGLDLARGLALGRLGHLYVTGATKSADFPTTSNAAQTVHWGGEEAFVTQISSDAGELLYSTFLGGTGNDRARNMALSERGDVHVTGFTSSTDFPTAKPFQAAYGGGTGPCFFEGGCDAFVTVLGKTAPVTVELSTTTASVHRGETLPVTLTLSNSTSRAPAIACLLAYRTPAGQYVPLLPPAPVTIAAGTTLVRHVTLPALPAHAPVGEWSVQTAIGWVLAGGRLEMLDHSAVTFRVLGSGAGSR